MSIKIYNTLTRKKEIFETIRPNEVLMYVCGPTVYNKAHIGHAMSALVFDLIRRYLQYRGYNVRFVMNYTDVDDKIIRRANEMGVDPFDLANTYIQEYQQHLDDLNVLRATKNPRATQEMEGIIGMIQGLIDRGYAYPLEGDVYFRVRQDEDYGRLSGRRLDDMQAGARIGVDARKEDPMDFALWKGAKEGEPAWGSPWGNGRPGWHIECSVMSMEHLGEQIDIHGGGNDLIFPHHENEIAQSESFTGKQFARYWVHNGMLVLRGEKMSKSLGNLITIEEFLSEHPADALRYLVLNSGYRNPLTFTPDVLQQAEKALERLAGALKPAMPGASGAPQASLDALEAGLETARNGFLESMNDDFNSAGALGHLFDLVRVINSARAEGATDAQLADTQALLRELTGVLGLTMTDGSGVNGSAAADPFISLLVDLRLQLRKEKNWALADQVRNRLTVLGGTLEDSKDGTTWHWTAK